ncbi:MAG: MgtC/SapB family protein [Rikenellaceae bacterium]|nr:MgtC/SapB family protein [Rikenellaceae bacterium]
MTFEFIIRMMAAGLFGTAIGLDREYRAKDAGFRTHFLVSLGSALFMLISQYGFQEFAGQPGVVLNPSRIAAQVVSGIGFIGAGSIIFQRHIVRGLTTAASLWATAGIGMAAGAGMYAVAATATVLTLIGLEALTLLFPHLGAKRTFIVFSSRERETASALFDKIQAHEYTVVSYETTTERAGDREFFRTTMVVKARLGASESSLLKSLQGNPGVTIEKIE